jgi:hypothetical protein
MAQSSQRKEPPQNPGRFNAFFTPIELEGLTQLEAQRHKCPLGLFA